MINIEILSTSFRIYCSHDGMIGDKQDLKIKPFLEINLSEWDFDKFKRRILKHRYVVFDKNKNYLYFPKYFLNLLTNLLIKFNKTYKLTYFPSNKFIQIDSKLNPKLIDKKDQAKAVDFILKSKNSMCCMELQTGFGKTYISIKAAILLKKTFLVLAPTHLIPQWEKSLFNITDLKEEDIYILKEKDSIIHLIKNDFKDNYKCYIGSIYTLTNYIKNTNNLYKNMIRFDEFIRKLKIGTKIIDEVHLNFYQIILLDMLCNIDTNIYLSGTYIRSSRQSNLIFQRTFPKEIKFTLDEYDKFVNITEYNYSIGYINNRHVMTERGYNQVKYEKYLLKRITKFNAVYNIISSIFFNKYISIKKKNDKCLILVKMKDITKKIVSKLKEEYKSDNLNIGEYLYETSNSQLEKLDVIVSTIGSCGVGKDIKDLRTVILFDSFKSESNIYQTLGRLRKLKDRIPEYAFMQNVDIPSHLYHRRIRRNILKHLTNNYQIINY